MRSYLLAAALALAASARAQTPTPAETPDTTPTPAAQTPTPEPNPPPCCLEPEDGPRVTAAAAPDDYRRDRERGTVRWKGSGNYSYHRVILPAARPLTIADSNFTQDKAQTVVFWSQVDAGINLATAVNRARVLPGPGHVPVDAEIGCVLRLRGAGWTRGAYLVTGTASSDRWILERQAAPAAATDGLWQLLCPIRDFSGIGFSSCNLKNAWLPAKPAFRPALETTQTAQEDLP